MCQGRSFLAAPRRSTTAFRRYYRLERDCMHRVVGADFSMWVASRASHAPCSWMQVQKLPTFFLSYVHMLHSSFKRDHDLQVGPWPFATNFRPQLDNVRLSYSMKPNPFQLRDFFKDHVLKCLFKEKSYPERYLWAFLLRGKFIEKFLAQWI